MNKRKIWFVTGASKGIGLTVVKTLLAQGFGVAATSRDRAALISKIGEPSEVFLPIQMEVTNEEDVAGAIEKTMAHFGKLDVLVNNAGYSQIGTIEELTDEEVKTNFEVNVFGYLNVLRKALPIFRKQQEGHIFNISSIGGFVGNFAGFGVYCSTKFAVAGFTEALAEEMKPFKVNTTVVYPGYFKTSFLSKGSVKLPGFPIAAYRSAREMEHYHINEIDGNQPNDPQRAADVLIELSQKEVPPVHFFMGSDAFEYARIKNELIANVLTETEALGTSTAFAS